MIQASLLTTTDIPDNDTALQKWSERIRSRIMTLTKQVSCLEEEKRTLLIKLQEASLSTLLMDLDSHPDASSPAAAVSNLKSVDEGAYDSAPVSIVDLVHSSQSASDAGNNDLIMDNNWLANEPICPEIDSERAFPDEVDSVLENLDPRELSFDSSRPLMMENSPPPNVPGASSEKRRVYKVCEFSDVDWDEVTSGELKQWLLFFGLKPALGGRKVMVEKLGQIFKYISGCTDDYPKRPDDQMSSKHQLFAQFRNMIVSNKEIYEKIVCFESIDIGEVFQYLGDSITDKTFSVKQVKEYLDQINVQYSTTSEKFSTKTKRVVSRKPRTVRKSISCPM